MEEKRTKLQIGCMAATGGVFLLFLVLYIVTATHMEYTLGGERFRVQSRGEQLTLTGRLRGTQGTITAAPTREGMDFTFDFAPYFSQTYRLALGEETTLALRVTDSVGALLAETPAPVRPITVTDGDGSLLLDAFYQDNLYQPFWDGEGNALEDFGLVQIHGVFTNPAYNWEGFDPPLYGMAQLAAGDNAPARREVPWLWFAFSTAVGGALCLTIAFPLGWFRLQHFLSVADPEPTELYLSMAKVGWVLSPVLTAAAYGAGLFLR